MSSVLAFFFAMKFLDRTRKYIVFEYSGLPFSVDGVRSKSGTLEFPRTSWGGFKEKGIKTFGSVSECEKFIKAHEDKMEFQPNKRIDKTLYNVQAKALKMSNNDWDIIRGIMTNPDRFEDDTEQIRVFESYLANNFMDRDEERFRKDVIKSFAETIVGKNKLMSHAWHEPGNGRFYKAKVVKTDIDETIKMVGGHPDKKFREHLEYIIDKDGAINWLVAYYYMLNVTEQQQEAVLNIDAGIWKDMSIGFRAPERVKIMSDDGERVLFVEYQNTKIEQAEALEGSHVGVPAQYGAGTSKDFKNTGYYDIVIENKINELKASGIPITQNEFNSFCIQNNLDEIEIDKVHRLLHKNNLTPKSFGIDTQIFYESKLEDITDKEVLYYINELDKKIKKDKNSNDWSIGYINTLKDSSFAFVEDGKVDKDGRTTPRKLRHLPIKNGNGINVRQLKNAFVRLNQITPVLENNNELFLEKVKKKLIDNVVKLNIREYKNRSNKMANIKLNTLDLSFTVDPENLDETLQVAEEKFDSGIQKMIDDHNSVISEKDEKVAELESDRDNAVDKMNDAIDEKDASDKKVKEIEKIFGENFTVDELQTVKDDAKTYKNFLVDEIIKYGSLCGMIEKEEVDNKKTEYESMSNKELEKFRSTFRKMSGVDKDDVDGQLPGNNGGDNPPEKKIATVRKESYMQDV